MSHTPGPWRYIKPDWKGMAYLFSKSTESTVATFFESPCNKSDCKLIAAAPELLEALERLIKSLLSNDTNCQATLREVLRGQAILERLKEDAPK